MRERKKKRRIKHTDQTDGRVATGCTYTRGRERDTQREKERKKTQIEFKRSNRFDIYQYTAQFITNNQD